MSARSVFRLARRALVAGAMALATLPGGATGPAGPAPVEESWLERVAYLWQSVRGHLDLLARTQDVDELIAAPATPAALRERLQVARGLRRYAVNALGLPDNPAYRRHATLGRRAVVWNVVAAPELSLRLHTWCFPVAGCVGYRGYFDEAQARALAQRLVRQGWEVHVYGVPAYSTLGRLPGRWLADPLLDTFIGLDDAELARLMFHELAHQVVYVGDDTMFNESYANAVGALGAQAWLASTGQGEQAEAVRQRDARRVDFEALVGRYRAELEALYASEATPEAKRVAKQQLFEAMRSEHRQMKAQRWAGHAGYDRFFAELGNARLGAMASYVQQQGDFERLFVHCGEHFGRFHAEVARLAALAPGERADGLSASRCERP